MMTLLREQFPADHFTLLALVLGLPLLGALVNGLFGKRLGKEGVRLLALVALAGSFLGSVAAFLIVATAPEAGGGSAGRGSSAPIRDHRTGGALGQNAGPLGSGGLTPGRRERMQLRLFA